MAIDIHIDTTARQDNKLNLYLISVNKLRANAGLTPYATITDLLKDLLIETAKSLVTSPDITDADNVRNAYLNASDAIQAQVKTLLGVT